MKTKRLIFPLIFSAAAGILTTHVQAAPFVVADDYPVALDPKPTHCGVLLDTAPKVQIPITSIPPRLYCKYDLSAVSNGNHTIKMTHILIDPLWGTLESAESSPLVFVRPAPPSSPAGLIITP